MAEAHVGFLVVVEEGRPVGVLTDRDVALRTLACGEDPGQATVGEIMSAPPITLFEERAAAEASAVMRAEAIRKLPLVDADGQLCGVVTADDLILGLGAHLQEIADAVRRGLENEAAEREGGSSLFGKE